MNALRTFLIAVLAAAPALALAQWQWIDKDGRRVFSDQPPPADVPAAKIVKQPGKATNTAALANSAAPVATSTAATAPAAGATPKLSGKDKDLEDKRKAAEAAEADRKKKNDQEVAQARAENCSQARKGKAVFDTGLRTTRVNDKGERVFMDEGERAAEVRRLDTIIARDCKSAQ